MKLWVTGAKGLVGSALIAKAKDFCVATGREIDIANRSACSSFLERHPTVTHIVNCAAFSAVDPAETLREEAHQANAIGPEVLGLCAKERGIRLLHLSTDYVFPGTGKVPLKETDPVAPCNFYGQTKREGEERLFAVLPTACILRTSWIFGSGGKNFVAKLLELLQTKEQLKLVSDQTGRPTYAPDLIEVILQMLNQSGLYQFANTGETNKYEFALSLQEQLKESRCRIEPVLSSTFPSAAKRPLYSAFDTTKIEQLLNFTPRHWKTCLREYVAQTHPV